MRTKLFILANYYLAEVGEECNNEFENIKDEVNCEAAAKDLSTTRLSFRDFSTISEVPDEVDGKHYMNGCHWAINGMSLFFNKFGFEGNCTSTIHPTFSDCRTICKRKGNEERQRYIDILF